MAETGEICQTFFVEARRLRRVGDDRRDNRVVSRTDAPQMQVGDTIRALFEAFPDRADERGIGADIQQNGASRADQSKSPV
jgi:hypothetical protein